MGSNRAFIEAFRSTTEGLGTSAPVASSAPPIAENPTWTTTISTSEYLGERSEALPAPEELSRAADNRTSTEGETENIFCFGPPLPRRGKRTLASLIGTGEAEATSAIGAQKSKSSVGPRWPVICQHLVSEVGREYDSLLRSLTETAGTGVLVGVGGVAPKGGCTTTAICLALRAAALGKSTLLVDADLDQPDLASMLGLKSPEPWPNLIKQGRPLMDGILFKRDVGVDLLLNAKGASVGDDAASTFRLGLAAGALRRKYQCVIVDLGLLADERAGAYVASAVGVDHVLLVAGPDSSDREVDLALGCIEHRQLAVSGILRAA